MYKFYFFLVMQSWFAISFAQSIESIKQHIINNNLSDAKTEVENFLSVPENKNNADAWYFKGFIYNLISKDTQFHIALTNTKAVAFNAFTTCLELRPRHKWLEKDNYYPFIDIYSGFFENGKQNYVQKNYDLAFDNFINAEKVEQYLFVKSITYKNKPFPALDTNLIYNIATCALNANKEKEGIFYFIKIAEAGLKDPVFLPVYHAIVDYFVGIHDEIGYRKYLKLGRSLFPYDNYWIESELDLVKAGNMNDALLKDYHDQFKKDPGNFDLHYSFCKDLMQLLFYSETKPRNFEMLSEQMENHLQICLRLQRKGVLTEFLYAQYNYHLGSGIRVALPDEPENTKRTAAFEKAIQYATPVFNEYEQLQNMNSIQLEGFKLATRILLNCHTELHHDQEKEQWAAKLKLIENTIPVYTPKKKN
jgi:hypothetical protein